jgi:hypothetical protein
VLAMMVAASGEHGIGSWQSGCWKETAGRLRGCYVVNQFSR